MLKEPHNSQPAVEQSSDCGGLQPALLLGQAMLKPILLMAHGRAGTTALMSLLGTDPAVAFDRVYPFEHRQLTYLAKLALLVDSPNPSPEFNEDHMRDIDSALFGPPTWNSPTKLDLFPLLWARASEIIGPGPYYAEKAPTWLSAFIESHLTPFNLFLFRDPRDNFISVLSHMRKRNLNVGFGRQTHDTDLTYAHNFCFRWLNIYQAWAMTRSNPRTLMVRYEDFVQDPAALATILNSTLNLNLNASALQDIPLHRTTATNAESINRHHAEPLFNGVIETYLSEEMAHLNYAAPPRTSTRHYFPAQQTPDGHLIPGHEHATVKITGPDFHFVLPIDPFDAHTIHSLWISARATVGDHCSVYWRREGEYFSEDRTVYCRYHPGNHWRILRFDFAPHPNWTGRIIELRLDLFNSSQGPITGICETTWYRFIPGLAK